MSLLGHLRTISVTASHQGIWESLEPHLVNRVPLNDMIFSNAIVKGYDWEHMVSVLKVNQGH